MKLFNKILCGIAVCTALVGTNAFGQGRGIDMFGVPRSIVLASPQAIGATSIMVTNGPIDIHGFDGIAAIDISWETNAAGNITTASFYTSPDTTNWTALANYAIATSLSQSYTNLFYGNPTNLVVTQTTLYPGTVVNPVSATAGFATPYLLAAPFTNSGALTLAGKGYYQIGFNASDSQRYIQVVIAPSGTATNANVGMLFKGFRQY